MGRQALGGYCGPKHPAPAALCLLQRRRRSHRHHGLRAAPGAAHEGRGHRNASSMCDDNATSACRRCSAFGIIGSPALPSGATRSCSTTEAKEARFWRGITSGGAFLVARRQPRIALARDAPFYIYYSMFGFHRRDLIWARPIPRARLPDGGTAARTTLAARGCRPGGSCSREAPSRIAARYDRASV